ncbi:MAG: glucuronyl hydrolase [Chitinophagaceae bacterium]|nr:MAG: glucuronyl hydrolase [Chitinophagaceae bacterium]
MGIKISVVILSCLSVVVASAQQKLPYKKIFRQAAAQTSLMLENTERARAADSTLVSPRTLDKGKLKLVASRDWTSGFFPGELWYLYEYTGKKQWKSRAISATTLIEKEKYNAGTHDMGFKMYCSFGNSYRLTNDPHAKEVLMQSARTLATRFNKTAGVIRSWDHNRDKWDYPVIIDNMLNLELLFAATKISGDSSFYKIAVAHANTTMKNHFRPDNSCYHVVDYDTVTGKVIKKTTHQGYSNESAWSRGQAWAVYGFTMCYRFTGDTAYLVQAEKTAGFMLDHVNLPADGVPYWDYNAPLIPNEERDASAAAVLASALYELQGYISIKAYSMAAGKIMESLTTHYRAAAGDAKGFILLHSTGSKAANSEVDVPLVYADYYYLEALLRSKSVKKYTSTSWK